MATVPASRPDLAAHREALRLPIPEIVKQLVSLIGRKLTAFVGGVRDIRAVDRWMKGSEPMKENDLPNVGAGDHGRCASFPRWRLGAN